MGLNSQMQALGSVTAARELQKQNKAAREAAKEPAVSDTLMRQLLWEQQSTNRMLWLLLSDKQRAEYSPPPVS